MTAVPVDSPQDQPAERVPDKALLSVRDLRAVFDTDDGVVQAVDGVSFDVDRGEVFAIVGESGSGKSVTAMTILGLLPTIQIDRGEILWKGVDLLTLTEEERRKIRGREIAMIFQDPLTALNPVHTVGRQIGEMARIHEGLKKDEALERAVEMLDLVGIPEPRKRATMFPHEFSGGMRQRAMIAMAITCKPDLLIADEPTTALDVTVQAQVLEVLIDIKDEIDSAIVLITHDLGVVAGLADRVMVMYAGRQAEVGPTADIFYDTGTPTRSGCSPACPASTTRATRPSCRSWARRRRSSTGPRAARSIPAAASPGCRASATPRTPRCATSGATTTRPPATSPRSWPRSRSSRCGRRSTCRTTACWPTPACPRRCSCPPASRTTRRTCATWPWRRPWPTPV